ncbi:MAG: non-canonical purine NTP pyrophosphatase [Bacteroidetes bacterium MED-G21]|nr:MAG: non-canonical purine NTP pyrophosphatase [Bacteroidetes bacterium MED-G21]
MKIVFATNNPNKLKEIQTLIPKEIEIISLKEIGCTEDIPETGDTLEANAFQKVHYIKENYNYDCFADDTGLEIDTLNGAPGVYSARYAGPEKSAEANIEKILNELQGKENRSAKFRTAIALTLNNEEHLFEGEINGHISKVKQGNEGFGYDPIFMPENEKRSFAQMSMEEKGTISHRGRAVKKLVAYLNNLSSPDTEQ